MNEQIIEEMVEEKTNKQWQIRDKYCLRIQKATQYKGDCDHEDVPSILVDYEKEIKKELIPEGAVVLTREEYEKLKLFEERVRSGVCFTQKEWFDYCQKDSNERTSLLIKAKKDTRKETAEKIMNEISGDTLTISTRDYGSIEVVPLDRISEICENMIKGDKQ